MSMMGWAPPGQVMADKADFARKGIARGRSLVANTYDHGVVIVAENPSSSLRKIGEIHDRIAFAGVGKYNEFDQLRIAGIRHADLKGYSFSREDVDGRSLANQYAQMIGQVFTHEPKPLEVEILVAELTADDDQPQLFHILYDGTVMDESRFVVLGGASDELAATLSQGWSEGMTLAAAMTLSVNALAGPDRTLEASDLEVAVLSNDNGRRAFGRLDNSEVTSLLAQ